MAPSAEASSPWLQLLLYMTARCDLDGFDGREAIPSVCCVGTRVVTSPCTAAFFSAWLGML